MTERELFREFYGLARMAEGQVYGYCPLADECEISAISNAVRAGMDDMTILGIKHSAVLALEASKAKHSEPSNHSAAIQMLVHTFGRVRRGA